MHSQIHIKYFFVMKYVIILLLIGLSLQQVYLCHYTCSTCSGVLYDQCTLCNANRGLANLTPIAGVCNCKDGMDEDEFTNCIPASTGPRLRATISILMVITFLLAIFTTLSRGMRYFLYKFIDDFQEVSLIAFINLYYPQQLDAFLKTLYYFNFTAAWKLFQHLSQKSLFLFSDQNIMIIDGQNLNGKFRYQEKSANFFSNAFNIILLGLATLGILALLNHFKPKIEKNSEKTPTPDGFKTFLKKIYNLMKYGFVINVFYFTLIQLNFNIAIQLANLQFPSAFSIFGIIMTSILITIEIIIFYYLIKSFKEEIILKPQFRDVSYNTMWYLIYDERKLFTKYFWFFLCAKKIVIVFLYAFYYNNPHKLILILACFYAGWMIFTVYCQPYERKYLRIFLYLTETVKCAVYVGLANFEEKYVLYLPLIQITNILYALIIILICCHLVVMLLHLWIEHEIYKHAVQKQIGQEVPKRIVGVFIEDKLKIYDEI